MKEHAGTWQTTVSTALNEIVRHGSVARDYRRTLFELLRSLRQREAPPAQIVIVRRVTVAAYRIEFSLLHAAAVDLAYARRELRAAKTAWTRFLAASGSPVAKQRSRPAGWPQLDLAA